MLGSSGGMESSDEKKNLNEDLVRFIRKRSDIEAPRYTARLKTYVDIQQKRRKAAVARRHSELNERLIAARKKVDGEPNENNYEPAGNRTDKSALRSSRSRSESPEPLDSCGRRRRRRKRSCSRRRRRRRRRSCPRSCPGRRRRRRRKSCRRRKRKSCKRRRRSRRRRRRC